MSKIFFQVVEAESRTGVQAQIYSESGRLLASHLMTIDGAVIRMRDLQATIADAMKRSKGEDMIDYPSLRVDSEHEETPRNGDSWCEVCGYVSKLDPKSDVVALWHGDSFGPDERSVDDATAIAWWEFLMD
jgi:hypothetical protein